MKKNITLILAAFILISGCLYAKTIKANAADISYPEPATQVISQINPKKPSETDSVIAILLDPYIDKAVREYYGKIKQTALYDAKVDYITQVDSNFIYKVTITVPTFTGAHNPPYGLETITFTVAPGGVVTLDDYEHKDVAPRTLSF